MPSQIISLFYFSIKPSILLFFNNVWLSSKKVLCPWNADELLSIDLTSWLLCVVPSVCLDAVLFLKYRSNILHFTGLYVPHSWACEICFISFCLRLSLSLISTEILQYSVWLSWVFSIFPGCLKISLSLLSFCGHVEIWQLVLRVKETYIGLCL